MIQIWKVQFLPTVALPLKALPGVGGGEQSRRTHEMKKKDREKKKRNIET